MRCRHFKISVPWYVISPLIKSLDQMNFLFKFINSCIVAQWITMTTNACTCMLVDTRYYAMSWPTFILLFWHVFCSVSHQAAVFGVDDHFSDFVIFLCSVSHQAPVFGVDHLSDFRFFFVAFRIKLPCSGLMIISLILSSFFAAFHIKLLCSRFIIYLIFASFFVAFRIKLLCSGLMIIYLIFASFL